MSGKDLKKLNKKQLEQIGRKHGIELDRRYTKATLIDQLEEVIEQPVKKKKSNTFKKEVKIRRFRTVSSPVNI